MGKRKRKIPAEKKEKPLPLQRHLLGTMFDSSRTVERVLSTGTTVRLRVEELEDGTVMVHEARRRKGDGNWIRWPEVEGVQSAAELRLDECRPVTEN